MYRRAALILDAATVHTPLSLEAYGPFYRSLKSRFLRFHSGVRVCMCVCVGEAYRPFYRSLKSRFLRFHSGVCVCVCVWVASA